MGLRKHGEGAVLRDDEQAKTAAASSPMSDADREALQAENDAADKDQGE